MPTAAIAVETFVALSRSKVSELWLIAAAVVIGLLLLPAGGTFGR